MKLFRKFRKRKAIPSYGEPMAPTAVIQYRELLDAIDDVARVFGDHLTAMYVGESFGCFQAEAIARLLVAAGHYDAADTWLDCHAMGDESGDAHYVEDVMAA